MLLDIQYTYTYTQQAFRGAVEHLHLHLPTASNRPNAPSRWKVFLLKYYIETKNLINVVLPSVVAVWSSEHRYRTIAPDARSNYFIYKRRSTAPAPHHRATYCERCAISRKSTESSAWRFFTFFHSRISSYGLLLRFAVRAHSQERLFIKFN